MSLLNRNLQKKDTKEADISVQALAEQLAREATRTTAFT